MNKLLGLFLLALAFLAPASSANAACSGGACFWIGGAGTLDNATDQAHWAITTGGSTCSCVPTTTDTVTFDASSGTGTVTLAVSGGTWTIGSLTLSNFNGTFDNSVNNNNVVTASVNNSSSVVRTFRMGTGNTYTLNSSGSLWNFGTTANLTLTGTSTIAFTNTTPSGKRFLCGTAGGQFGTVTVAANSQLQFQSGGCNITTLTITAPNRILFAGGQTYTIGTFTNISASAASPALINNDAPLNGVVTISSANNWTCDFCGVAGLAMIGGGTFAATNSYGFLQNTGITITPPSGGGGPTRFVGG